MGQLSRRILGLVIAVIHVAATLAMCELAESALSGVAHAGSTVHVVRVADAGRDEVHEHEGRAVVLRAVCPCRCAHDGREAWPAQQLGKAMPGTELAIATPAPRLQLMIGERSLASDRRPLAIDHVPISVGTPDVAGALAARRDV